MKKTYNSILEDMREAFYQNSGYTADTMSEIDLRFKAVAAELYAVSCYGDFIFTQAFPQTARGVYLDYHGAMHGVERKAASKAVGQITFSIEEALQSDVAVPSGTVCSVKDKPLIQFETTHDAVIGAGETSVTVNAQALETGYAYNVKDGDVNTAVTAPTQIVHVNNAGAFHGGCDAEGDESYRQRIIDRCKLVKNGVNTASLEAEMMAFDEVLDCNIVRIIPGFMNAYVRTRTGSIGADMQKKLQNILGVVELTGGSPYAFEASPKNFSLTVQLSLRNGCDAVSVHTAVENRVNELCAVKKIGESIVTSRIAANLNELDDVEEAFVFSSKEHHGLIACSGTEYLNLEQVTVYDD